MCFSIPASVYINLVLVLIVAVLRCNWASWLKGWRLWLLNGRCWARTSAGTRTTLLTVLILSAIVCKVCEQFGLSVTIETRILQSARPRRRILWLKLFVVFRSPLTTFRDSTSVRPLQCPPISFPIHRSLGTIDADTDVRPRLFLSGSLSSSHSTL